MDTIWITSKLEDPWSSERVASLLTPEIISALEVKCAQLETATKLRLMFSFVGVRKHALSQLNGPILSFLQKAKTEDSDEWVRHTAALILSLWRTEENPGDRALNKIRDPQVEQTISDMCAALQPEMPKILRFNPLQDCFLDKTIISPVCEPKPHFTVKKDAIPPISSSMVSHETNVMSSNATTILRNPVKPIASPSANRKELNSSSQNRTGSNLSATANNNRSALTSSTNAANPTAGSTAAPATPTSASANNANSNRTSLMSSMTSSLGRKRMKVLDLKEVKILTQHQEEEKKKKKGLIVDPAEELAKNQKKEAKRKRKEERRKRKEERAKRRAEKAAKKQLKEESSKKSSEATQYLSDDDDATDEDENEIEDENDKRKRENASDTEEGIKKPKKDAGESGPILFQRPTAAVEEQDTSLQLLGQVLGTSAIGGGTSVGTSQIIGQAFSPFAAAAPSGTTITIGGTVINSGPSSASQSAAASSTSASAPFNNVNDDAALLSAALGMGSPFFFGSSFTQPTQSQTTSQNNPNPTNANSK